MKMLKDKARVVVLCGALAFVLCGLFPPWLYTVSQDGYAANKSAGFGLLFDAPDPSNRAAGSGIRLDTARLAVEWLCVLAATGALWLWFAKPGSPPQI